MDKHCYTELTCRYYNSNKQILCDSTCIRYFTAVCPSRRLGIIRSTETNKLSSSASVYISGTDNLSATRIVPGSTDIGATTTTVHFVSRAEQSVGCFSDVIKQNDAVVWVGLVSQRQRYTAAAHWRLLCWRTGHCRTVSFRTRHCSRTVSWRLSFRTGHRWFCSEVRLNKGKINTYGPNIIPVEEMMVTNSFCVFPRASGISQR